MIYRRFGKTELMMPVLSFGCMRSMQSWQDTALTDIETASQDNLEALVHTALSHGITHIETASGYGSSERQLGPILEQLPRQEFLLQTKVVPSADPDEFVNKVMLSMERLRVDRLDLLALHGINDYRSLWQCCKKNGCLAAARKLQDKGLIDHLGFSGHGPCEVIVEALTHQEDGGFDYCNIHWYYILDVNRAALETAAGRDIGIFIISPSDKGGHLHTPSDTLQDLCAPYSPMLFNDLYCLDQPGVQTISIGASEPHHFDEHLKVLPLLEGDMRSDFQQIDTRLRQAMYDATGFERPDQLWDLLPAWEQAPGNINLKMVLWLYNLYHGWDMKNYSRERYQNLSSGSSWIPGNNGATAAMLDLSSPAQMAGLEPERLRRLLLEAHQLLSKKNRSAA
jgi:hypothetical protein